MFLNNKKGLEWWHIVIGIFVLIYVIWIFGDNQIGMCNDGKGDGREGRYELDDTQKQCICPEELRKEYMHPSNYFWCTKPFSLTPCTTSTDCPEGEQCLIDNKCRYGCIGGMDWIDNDGKIQPGCIY